MRADYEYLGQDGFCRDRKHGGDNDAPLTRLKVTFSGAGKARPLGPCPLGAHACLVICSQLGNNLDSFGDVTCVCSRGMQWSLL